MTIKTLVEKNFVEFLFKFVLSNLGVLIRMGSDISFDLSSSFSTQNKARCLGSQKMRSRCRTEEKLQYYGKSRFNQQL